MSDANLPSYPSTPEPAATVAPRENVLVGLAASLLAVVGGIILTVILAKIGFIAAITSFAIAFGAVWLYVRGAGALPRKGLVPLVLLIILGVVMSFFSIVATDLNDVYSELLAASPEGAPSRFSFIGDNIFNGDVLREYGKDAAFFGVFALLGIYSTLKQLFSR